MKWGRLDLTQIERALHALGDAASSGRIDPDHADEPINDEVLRRMFGGYRYVDELLAGQTDIFAYGRTSHIVELNHQVLCGASPERRRQFSDHIAETERWFYDRPEGIGAFFDWYRRSVTQAPVTLAAGVFVHTVSLPQLFIEGNGRTATLLASYVLARAGLPPLVVTPGHYPCYREAVSRCVALDRHGFASGFAIARTTRRVSAFLHDAADPGFSRAPAAPAPPAERAAGIGQPPE